MFRHISTIGGPGDNKQIAPSRLGPTVPSHRPSVTDSVAHFGRTSLSHLGPHIDIWVFLVALAVAEIIGLAYRRLTAPWVRRVPEFTVAPEIALPTHYLKFAGGVVLIALVMLGYALIRKGATMEAED